MDDIRKVKGVDKLEHVTEAIKKADSLEELINIAGLGQ